MPLADAEEFRSWTRERLMEDDYDVIRKFGGRSTLRTYLVVVITHFYSDFRNSEWGRWRPSAIAQRLGPTAVRLEELMVRDGSPLLEAARVVLSADPSLREADLLKLARSLPRRVLVSEVSLDATDGQDVSLAREPAELDVDRTRVAVQQAVYRTLNSLSPEDRVITRMRFWDNMSIAEIARSLRLEQKPLYRRLQGIQAVIRASLTAQGVRNDDVRLVLSDDLEWDPI
ncbi:MAG: hypothetical protein ACT4P7_09390 [Gemmatimonadaceae bacterium]